MAINLNTLKKLRNQLDKVRYKCKEWCFECCTMVPMTEQELKLIKKELQRKGYTDPPYWKWKLYCAFLTSEGKCSVYNERPIICRWFSDVWWKMQRKWKSAVTQSCTYAPKRILPASQEFIRYWKEVSEDGIVMENAEEIMKSIIHPIF